MIDFKQTQKILNNADWFYKIPVGYSYHEAIENHYEIEPVLYFLTEASYGLKFIEDFYNENQVEIEDYLATLESAGDQVEDEKYKIRLFLDYFANAIARARILSKRRKMDIPEWLEFTIAI